MVTSFCIPIAIGTVHRLLCFPIIIGTLVRSAILLSTQSKYHKIVTTFVPMNLSASKDSSELPLRGGGHQRELFLKHVAQTSPAPLALEITKAAGTMLYDAAGKEYIDLIGGISVANTGH